MNFQRLAVSSSLRRLPPDGVRGGSLRSLPSFACFAASPSVGPGARGGLRTRCIFIQTTIVQSSLGPSCPLQTSAPSLDDLLARRSRSLSVKLAETSFFNALKKGDDERIELLWEELQAHGCVSTLACNTMMTRASNTGNFDRVLYLWKWMDTAQIEKSTPSYNILLAALGRAGHYQEMLLVLRDMEKTLSCAWPRYYRRPRTPAPDTVRPNRRTIETVLFYLSKHPKVRLQTFLMLWKNVREFCSRESIPLNTRMCNAALHYYCSKKRGGLVGQLQLLNKMCETSASMPDQHSFEIVARSLQFYDAASVAKSTVMRCAELMRKHRISPSLKFFALALLKGRGGLDREVLDEFLSLMDEFQIKPDELIYIELLNTEKALNGSDCIQRMQAILERAQRDGQASQSAYNIVLAALNDHGCMDLSGEVVKAMVDGGVPVGRYTMNTILHSCSLANKGAMVWQTYKYWLQLLKSGSIEEGPDSFTYGTLLDSIRRGNPEITPSDIFAQMKENEIPLDTFSGNMLLQMYWKYGSEETTLKLIDILKWKKIPFDQVTFMTMMEIYRDMDRPAHVLQTFRQLLVQDGTASPAAVQYLLDVLRNHGDMCENWRSSPMGEMRKTGLKLRHREVKPLLERIERLPGVEEALKELEAKKSL